MAMLTNPRRHSIKLTLSDGSERIIGPWGLAVLPDYDQRGQRLEITATEIADPGSTTDSAPVKSGAPTPRKQRAA